MNNDNITTRQLNRKMFFAFRHVGRDDLTKVMRPRLGCSSSMENDSVGGSEDRCIVNYYLLVLGFGSYFKNLKISNMRVFFETDQYLCFERNTRVG